MAGRKSANNHLESVGKKVAPLLPPTDGGEEGNAHSVGRRLLVVMAKAAREALKRLTEPELRRIVREELDYFRREFDARMDGLEAKVDATNQRIDSAEKSVNQRIDVTNQRIDSLERSVNQRLDDLRQQVVFLQQLVMQALDIRPKPQAASPARPESESQP